MQHQNISPDNKSEYKITTLDNIHIESTAKLFTTVFCEGEPLTRHLQVPYDDFYPFAKEVVEKAATDKLSMVAVDHENKVIACIISEDISDPFMPNVNAYPTLAPIFEFIERLSKSFTHARVFTEKKIAHMWVTAIDNKYKGKGLSKKINDAGETKLKEDGFEFGYAEFTSEINERWMNKFDVFERCSVLKFEDQTDERLKGLPGRATSYVWPMIPTVNFLTLYKNYIHSDHSVFDN